MKIRCVYEKLESVDALVPHPKNNNKHPKEQIKRLAQILEYQGWRYPVKISKLSGYVTSGHGRIEAAKLNGWKEIPVNYQEYESKEQEYADLMADNAIALWAEFDVKNIAEDLKDLEPFDVELLGIEDFKLPDPSKDEIEDEIPEVKTTDIVLGDMFQLGEHRLLCGDCTIRENVEKLMGSEKADMVFTDPPYGMNLDTDYSKMGKTTTKYKKVENDDKPFNSKFIFDMVSAKYYWLWGADYYCKTIPFYEDGNFIVWTKAHSDLENKVFTSRYELVWVYPKIHREVWFCRSMQHRHDERLGEHPTQKPIELFERAIDKHEDANNILDLFGGSGSTLIACEKTNRKCFMMELDPLYCQVIIDRWEKYSGKKAEKVVQ